MERDKEVFKPIKGYEGLYEISNHGNVKSLAKTWSVGVKGDTILKPGGWEENYVHVVLSMDKVKRHLLVHRLVALHFCDNPNNYPVVNHKNSNRRDNYYGNLEWATQKQNVQHGYEHGYMEGRKGLRHHNCKLSEYQISEIKKMYNEKYGSQKEIAKVFNIKQSQVSRIVTGRRWSHI